MNREILPWRIRALVLFLVLAAFALRVHRLSASGLWFDEATSYFVASQGIVGGLRYLLNAPREHPPGYYLSLTAWMSLAGSSEFSLRFFSVLFGVLFIPLFYRFACRHFDTRLVLPATTLSVALPFLVDYSQEARMYTMVLCPTVLAMDYFLRWARGDGQAASKHLAFLAVAIAIHYYAIMLMVVQDFYLLGRRQLWPAMGRLTVLWHLALAAAFATWLAAASGPIQSARQIFVGPLYEGRNLDDPARIAVDLTVGGIEIRPLASVDYLLAAGVCFIILVGGLWAFRHLNRCTRGLPLCSWLFATAALPPLLVFTVPYWFTAARYLFVTIPALLVLLACGLLALRNAGRVFLSTGLALLLVAFGYGINFNYHFSKSPYRDMAAIVTSQARADDGLILAGTGQWPLALYYLRGPWARSYIPQGAADSDPSAIEPALLAMRQAHGRLWLIAEQSWTVDPNNNTSRWLALNTYPVLRQWFQVGDAVALYLSDRSLTDNENWGIQFGEWLVLDQSSTSALTVSGGDGLAVRLAWRAVKPIPQTVPLLMTLRLWDSTAHVVQERVAPPCDGFCPLHQWAPGEVVVDRHGLVIPAELPEGEYVLRLEVYAPHVRRSLPIEAPPSAAPLLGEGSASLELARINVRSPSYSAQR